MIGAFLGLIAGVIGGFSGLSWWWLPAWAGGGFVVDLVMRVAGSKPDSGLAEAFSDCMSGIADVIGSMGGDSGGSSGSSCGGGSGCGGGGCGGGGGD